MKVYFIGAGPGDPELLTLKGARLIESADLVIYTGSLVPKAVVGRVKPGAEIWDSSDMELGELVSLFIRAQQEDKIVARVHTGDPSLYGSIAEQIRELDRLGIAWQVIPGVSSFTAAAAALGQELTLPGVSQTVILTRAAGRTGVPDHENLARLGEHRATMVLFLSTGLITKVQSQLLPHYGADCPVRVVYHASQPDEQVIAGTLGDIDRRLKAAAIHSTAIIIVGRVLENNAFAHSKLYDAEFSHGFRTGKEDH